MSGSGFEREYRLRKKPPLRVLVLSGVLLLLTAWNLFHLIDGSPGWGAVMILLMGPFIAWAVLWVVRSRTVVGPQGITTRGVVCERRWTWRDIRDIQVESFPDRPSGAAQSGVAVFNVEGRRFLLPHLNDLQVDVHVEAAAIRAVWRELRGAG